MTTACVTIKRIQCVTVSSGVDSSIKSLTSVLTGIGVAAGTVVLTEGAGAFAAGAAFFSGKSIAEKVIDEFDKDLLGDTDNVYLQIGDQKAWGTTDMKVGADVTLNASRLFDDSVEICLYDKDEISDDDLLGKMTVTSDTPSGQYVLYNTEEGSSYLVDLEVQSERFKIQNKNSGLVVGVDGMSTVAGANIIQWGDNGTLDQLWLLEADGEGNYKIRNDNSSLVMGVNGMSLEAGGQIIQWGDNGTTDHLWTFIPADDGYFKIQNSNSSLVMGVNGMSLEAGGQIIQWGDDGTPDHLWSLI